MIFVHQFENSVKLTFGDQAAHLFTYLEPPLSFGDQAPNIVKQMIPAFHHCILNLHITWIFAWRLNISAYTTCRWVIAWEKLKCVLNSVPGVINHPRNRTEAWMRIYICYSTLNLYKYPFSYYILEEMMLVCRFWKGFDLGSEECGNFILSWGKYYDDWGSLLLFVEGTVTTPAATHVYLRWYDVLVNSFSLFSFFE